ncbi:hypothetical protein BC831DRAFT_483837 [Entophlyctis helioformis]|nr:hypothetical protein BC831DRAFT_483837 [Entophlyctis helioformis]
MSCSMDWLLFVRKIIARLSWQWAATWTHAWCSVWRSTRQDCERCQPASIRVPCS